MRTNEKENGKRERTDVDDVCSQIYLIVVVVVVVGVLAGNATRRLEQKRGAFARGTFAYMREKRNRRNSREII